MHRLRHQIMQTGAAMGDTAFNRDQHARFPELLQMIGDTRHRFVVRIGGKIRGDLIRHANQAVGMHVPASLRSAIRSGWV